MMWKPFFAAACAAALAVPAAFAQGSTGGGKPSLSFSFANGNGTNHILVSPSTVDPLGIEAVPVANWIDLVDEDNGTINAVDVIPVGDDHAYNFTLPAPVTVTYSAKNGYEYVTDATRTFLRAYLDDGENPNNDNKGARITVDNVPFTRYDVIVYLATDTQSAKFLPVTVNGNKYIGIEEAEGGSQIVTDNTTTWGASQKTVANLGKNALRVNGLEGTTLTIEGSKGGNARCGIAAFQIICAKGGELRTSTQPVLSLNFASGRTNNNEGIAESKVATKTGNYGLAVAPADTWVDLTGATGAQRNVTKLHGSATVEDWSAATVTWEAKNTWSYGSDAAEAAEPFLPTYLGDGKDVNTGVDGVAVSVSSVPFEAYDAIVYFSNDAGRKYRPVQINNTYYTYNDAYGAIVVGSVADATQQQDPNAFGAVGQQATAKLGVNALRVNGLKGDFSLQGATVTDEDGIASSTYDRCGIAAVQLVARKLIIVSNQTNWADISAGLSASDPVLIVFQNGGSITGNVTLPADAILDFSGYTFGETAPFSGTLTMNGGTIRLPAGFESGRIATSISGNNFDCFIAGKPVWLKLDGDTGTLAASYLWTDQTGNHLWSDPGNWVSLIVPGTGSNVFFEPAASRPETVILDTVATVASVTVEGRGDTVSTLAIGAQEGGSLTVSGQMLTTGNVTVTQSADITVNGKSTMVCPSGAPQTYPERGAFHVEGAQAEYKVVDGTLSVPTKAEEFGFGFTDLDRTAGGFVVVCDNAKLTVGGGTAEAVLSVYSCRMPWPSGYPASGVALAGTVEVLSNGVFETDKNANFAGGPKLVTNGGTVRVKESLASVTYGSGYAPTSPLTLSAPEGATLTFSAGESGTLLTGSADVLIKGPGTVALVGAIDAETYTGEISVQENGNLTLADNQRPKLTVSGGASLDVTPSDTERGNGAIVFPTSMMETPNGVTYTVSGLAEGTVVSASVAENTLTLRWEADYPTLSTSVSWSSTENWTNLPEGTSFPSSGSAILDGTQAAITVTLDTDLSEMTSIFVKGDVTLVTKGTESTTIPACVALTTGATLTVDADFSGAWELPAGTTLQVNQGFTSFAGLTLEGAVVILEGASGTDGTLTEIGAPRPVEFNGGLTIAASNLTLKSVYNVGTTLALEGDNITIEGNSLFTDNGTEVVNEGTDNAITGVTGLNGSLAVESGALKLTLEGDQPTTTSFLGATIAKDATLTLAGTSGWFPATGAGTYAVGTNRPQFAVMTVGETLATDIPAKMILSATADEQSAGRVRFLTSSGAVTIPDGFVAEVKPYDEAPEWVPAYVRQGTWGIDICNVPAPNGLSGLDDAVALALRQAAAKEGITSGNYTVRLTTGGGRQTVDAPDVATLNDVLGCFTGLTATASDDKATLTYAYEFGISGVRRTKTGWEVVVKVTGAEGATAGFAEGNVYTVKDATVKSLDVSKAAQGEVVLSVTGELKKVSVSVAPRQTTEP